MIDTLARHLAALSEARRLMSMVLAKNPEFARWRDGHPDAALGGPKPPLLDPQLAEDAYFKAYRHITAAIELLEPKVAAPMPLETTIDHRKTGAIANCVRLLPPTRASPIVAPAPGLASPAAVRMADAISQAHHELAKKELMRREIEPTQLAEADAVPTEAPSDGPSTLPEVTAAQIEATRLEVASIGRAIAAAKTLEAADTAQAAARIVNDNLVYAAPRWTEASVEIVRAPAMAAHTAPAATTAETGGRRWMGWLGRLAGAH